VHVQPEVVGGVVRSLPVTERVGSYVLVRRIGSGGMAEVWLGRHVVSGGVAAVKRLAPHARHQAARVGEFLAREAHIIARLAHPHIVPLFEYGEGFVVMPYIDGMSLSRRMQTPLAPDTGVAIVRQVAAALAHAHERGVVHRDVKPSNILLDQQGTAYLSDFGVAVSAQRVNPSGGNGVGRGDEQARIAGTPRYMAPEQMRGERVGPAADQYGLARTLLEILTGGKLPACRDEALAQLPAALGVLRPVLDRGTATDPAARFPSMAAFGDALAALDLGGAAATVRTAELRRAPDPYPWSAAPRGREALGPALVRGDYRLRELAACGRLEPARVERFLDGAGLAELGFSIYASTPRLGDLDDPDLLARVTEVIVLCHGSFCSRRWWRLVAPGLCRDHALALVLVPDLHGFGDSAFAGTPTPEQASLRGMADQVLGLTRLLGLAELPTVLVGHSMGAMSLLTLDDGELAPHVARVLINPLLVDQDPRLRRALRTSRWLTRALSISGTMHRAVLRGLCRRGPSQQLTAEDQDEMFRLGCAVTPAVIARLLEAKRLVSYKRGRHRRVALLSGVDDPWVRDRAFIDTAAADLGIDPAHVHLLASGGHSPHVPLAHHPEWTARNVDEISRVIQAMMLTAHEPEATPSMTVTAGSSLAGPTVMSAASSTGPTR
jgi:alpha-beta hydrolase superfamily lysophospholipase